MMNIEIKRKQCGFSLLEMLIVVSIILIVGAMIMPKMLEVIDRQKLQSNLRSYAGLVQTARMRAAGDDAVYQPLIAVQNGATYAYVDLNGSGAFDVGEPSIQLPTPITVTDTGAPVGFDAGILLGMQPLNLETSPMVNAAGVASPGVAFNQRGLPCQRIAAGGTCLNTIPQGGGRPVGWVTYLQYQLRSGGIAWGAVTVTPAGRIKTWTYINDGQGGGTWK